MPIRTGAPRPGTRVAGRSKATAPGKSGRTESSSAAASVRGHGITDGMDRMNRPPDKVVSQFFDALSSKRIGDLAHLYSAKVHFKDPIFEFSSRDQTMNMWRKVMATDPNASIQFSLEKVDGETVT